MSKKRKQKRTLNVIGEKKYSFNFEFEKNIYSNLCCIHVKKKVLKNLNKDNLNFCTYNEWRQYIYGKYEGLKSEELSEFSRYLKQRIRNIESGNRYWELFVPVILTLIFTNLFNIVIDLNWNLNDFSIIAAVFFVLFFEIIFAAPVIMLVWITMKPIWDNNIDRNFFTDYKEIIDCMIEEKELQDKTKL